MHHNAYTVTAFIMLITSSSSKGSCDSNTDDSEIEDLIEPYDVNMQHCLYTMHHEFWPVYNN